MLFWQKLALVLAAITAIFLAGMYTQAKFHLAGEAKVFKEEVKKAQDGQNDIIDFNQQVQKIYVKVKEPCLDTPVPPELNKLLK